MEDLGESLDRIRDYFPEEGTRIKILPNTLLMNYKLDKKKKRRA